MEEESLGDKNIEDLPHERCRLRATLRYANTRKLSYWANRDLWINGASNIILLFLLVGFLSLNPVNGQSPPPNYNYKKLPETSFTCEDKATGGYYADPEAGCQMFHVCLRVSEEQINDFKFLCPNNTVFDQQNFICTNWWEIDCQRSTRYYSKNDLFKVAEETTTAEPEYEQQSGYFEYVYEYVDSDPIEKNNTARKLPETKRRLKSGRSLESTTIRIDSTVKSASATPNTTSERYTTTELPTTTPKITTFRYRHRFSYQSEDNIGKRVYQPAYGNKEENSPSTDRKRARKPAALSKSLDAAQEPSQERQIRRKKINKTDINAPKTDFKLDVKPEVIRRRNQTPTTTTTKQTPSTNAPRVKALRRRTNRRQKSIPSNKPNEKHKEFSNFRFYKTAFGRSYSSNDYLQTTTTPRSAKRRARFRRPKRVRTGRTASRNTRYSKYAAR